MAYRISRNIEKSLIDKITADLVTDGWTGIRVEKSFSKVYEGDLPVILVSELLMSADSLEIGDTTKIKYFTIEIRIFATDNGNRLDLSDWLFDRLNDDSINYYVYTVVNGVVSSKVLTGKIIIMNFLRNEQELVNTENLAQEDKFRHLLSFRCFVAS